MKKTVHNAGLGDVVEVVTRKTGVKAAVEAVATRLGRDCGCKKRKDALNRMVPFRNRRTDDEGTDTPLEALND